VVGKRGTASVTIQEIQERLGEYKEAGMEAQSLESGLKPLDLAAGSKRLETGIGAND
jgi:hypothetical protein